MKPITSEEDRQERIAQVRRQLGSLRTAPSKRKDLQRYLTKLQRAEATEVQPSDTYTAGHNSCETCMIDYGDEV